MPGSEKYGMRQTPRQRERRESGLVVNVEIVSLKMSPSTTLTDFKYSCLRGIF